MKGSALNYTRDNKTKKMGDESRLIDTFLYIYTALQLMIK